MKPEKLFAFVSHWEDLKFEQVLHILSFCSYFL